MCPCSMKKATGMRRRRPLLLLLLAAFVGMATALQYKVGDLDAWGVPPPGKPQLYSAWSETHNFKLGDSLLFLYPPSEDSVVQVTEAAFDSCSLGEPIVKVDDGNSLFNLTIPGVFYFTSGVPGHCQKHQRLRIAVPSSNGTFFPADAAGRPAGSLTAGAPAYPSVFGPAPPAGASPPALGAELASGLSSLGLILFFWV